MYVRRIHNITNLCFLEYLLREIQTTTRVTNDFYGLSDYKLEKSQNFVLTAKNWKHNIILDIHGVQKSETSEKS